MPVSPELNRLVSVALILTLGPLERTLRACRWRGVTSYAVLCSPDVPPVRPFGDCTSDGLARFTGRLSPTLRRFAGCCPQRSGFALGWCSKLVLCAAWLLRDEARGAKSKASLNGLPEFATQRIARKTTARQGSAQNGRLTHLLACVCRPAHDAPSRHASHPVLNPNAHRGSLEHRP